MNKSTKSSLHPESPQGQPFTIQLTYKQALFLSKALPLRYSLHPQRKKKPTKTTKSTSKLRKHSNLPSRNIPKPPSAQRSEGNSSQMSIQMQEKQFQHQQQSKSYSQVNEETRSMQNFRQQERKVEVREGQDWRLQFLKNARSHSLFVRAYGEVFSQLEQRIRGKLISQADFHQTIVNVINDEKMRRTKPGLQLSEQLKRVYLKYRNKVAAFLQTKQAIKKKEELQKSLIASVPTNATNVKKKETSLLQPKTSPHKLKKGGSESSDDLGVDFDLSEYEVNPSLQFGDKQFLDATFISRNLRKVPSTQALSLLAKFGIYNIDVLKIKTLSSKDITFLKHEVNNLKKKYPSISEPQEKDVQSSFSLEEDQ